MNSNYLQNKLEVEAVANSILVVFGTSKLILKLITSKT